MKTLSTEPPAKTSLSRRNSHVRQMTPPAAPVSWSAFVPGIIQRLSVCPCDGGCPRCAPVTRPKLTVGVSDDTYEQEANRVAGETLHMPGPATPKVTQESGLGHLTVHRAPADVAEPEVRGFDLSKWFGRFELAVTYSLSRFYIGRGEVSVQQVEDVKGLDDLRHPAHYNPNDRTIYFSALGFRSLYNDRVRDRQVWTEDKYEDTVIEVAAHEAFHAYQDTPRHRSKKFAAFEKRMETPLRQEMTRFAEYGVIDTYEEFKKSGIRHFTQKYLPESTIKEFMGENLPGMRRDPKWQLSAREEIMNQWLRILNDWYWRTRPTASYFRRRKTGKGLPKEEPHRVSLTERQAETFGAARTAAVKLWLLKRQLEDEEDPEQQQRLKEQIKALTAQEENLEALFRQEQLLPSQYLPK